MEGFSLVKAGIEVDGSVCFSLLETPLAVLLSALLCVVLDDAAGVLLMLPLLESELGGVDMPVGVLDSCLIASEVCRVSFSLWRDGIGVR